MGITTLPNKDLRLLITRIIRDAGEGHIPSSFSIIDVLDVLYGKILSYNTNSPKWENRDYFVLSKGHGAAAFFVVLHKYGFITDEELHSYSQRGSILGGHPDMTKVPGAECSTGSLGHGFPMAVGIALGLKVEQKWNHVVALLGDGECNEGTIWESALVAAKQQLDQLLVIVDLNESAAQVLPVDPLLDKWLAFGWEGCEIDGHDPEAIESACQQLMGQKNGKPKVIIAQTVKGKGVSFVEGHGKWHHRIPNDEEFALICEELS